MPITFIRFDVNGIFFNVRDKVIIISTTYSFSLYIFTFLKQWLANMYVNLCWDHRSMICWFRILRHDFRDFWGPRCIARMFILGMSNKCLMCGLKSNVYYMELSDEGNPFQKDLFRWSMRESTGFSWIGGESVKAMSRSKMSALKVAAVYTPNWHNTLKSKHELVSILVGGVWHIFTAPLHSSLSPLATLS